LRSKSLTKSVHAVLPILTEQKAPAITKAA
jgi:hypothetical protein